MDALEMRTAAATRVVAYLDGLAKRLDQEDRVSIVTISATCAISTPPDATVGEYAIADTDHIRTLAEWGITPEKDPFTYAVARAAYLVAIVALFEMKAVQS